MGLDLYAGPVSRYAGGDWKSIIQQAGAASGNTVVMVRRDVPRLGSNMQEVSEVVARWRSYLVASLGLTEEWQEDPAGDYFTDKPDWYGYGAVVLLAAYDEQPGLVPGAEVRRFLGRSKVHAVAPIEFTKAPAFKAAYQSPVRYPALLGGAKWCLPLAGGPAVFQALNPWGTPMTMARVSQLVEELDTLNQRTLKLSAAELAAASQAGPSTVDAPLESMAPFGLGVLTAVTDFAATHHVAWIMDY